MTARVNTSVQPLRVAIVARTARRRGGTESYLFDLVQGFTRAGHAVDVFAAGDDKDSPATAAGAQVFVSRLGKIPGMARPWALRQAWNRQLDRTAYDLTISLARVNGQDLAICGGTHLGFLQATGQKLRLRDRSELALERRCYRESKIIVAHSHRMRQELCELYDIAPGKIAVIHPPIDALRFHPQNAASRAQARARLGLSTDKTVLLFPSTGHERKGLPLLLAALDTLPREQYELAVAGNDSGLLSGRSNVKFLGFVRDMADAYRAADLTVLPSHYEPFGLVITESVACGTPVVTHRGVGACDLIGQREGIVLDELSVAALSAALASAESRKFAIDATFAQRNGLTIDAHVSRLCGLSQPAQQVAA